jgi:hypothetical protein
MGIKGEDADLRMVNVPKPKPFGTTILSSPTGLIWNDASKDEDRDYSGLSSRQKSSRNVASELDRKPIK